MTRIEQLQILEPNKQPKWVHGQFVNSKNNNKYAILRKVDKDIVCDKHFLPG